MLFSKVWRKNEKLYFLISKKCIFFAQNFFLPKNNDEQLFLYLSLVVRFVRNPSQKNASKKLTGYREADYLDSVIQLRAACGPRTEFLRPASFISSDCCMYVAAGNFD